MFTTKGNGEKITKLQSKNVSLGGANDYNKSFT